MKIGSTVIEDTFAEAFRARCARVIVTGPDLHWVEAGVASLTGGATSVIGCDCEAGRERLLEAGETPDGRPGASALFFAFTPEALGAALAQRTGQSLLTCPGAAAYDGFPDSTVPADEVVRVPLGGALGHLAGGFRPSKVIAGRRFLRIPVMDGEFVVEETVGVIKAVAGGNLIVQGSTHGDALGAARRAVEAVAPLAGVITPFPGGAVRSGSKVGSRYKGLKASTNEAYCPTLRGRVATALHPDAQAACEVVIDGVDEASVARALREGIRAAAGAGVVAITAGNYGGKLGKFHFRLHELLA